MFGILEERDDVGLVELSSISFNTRTDLMRLQQFLIIRGVNYLRKKEMVKTQSF